MSRLVAANAFNVPEATLRRHLKKNEKEMPAHGGRFREIFSAAHQEDLKFYSTAMDKILFGLTKKQCREDWFFDDLREQRGKYKFPASSIYNVVQSGLSPVLNKLPMEVSPTGSRRVSKIASAERGRNVTIICCISTTGFYLLPFLIFARKRMLPALVGKGPPATFGNAVKGFKECRIKPPNPLEFSEHDFSAANTTDHDVIGDATENNSANPKTLVVENQHINTSKEPELMAKADSNILKKPVSVFYFKLLPKATQCEKKKAKKHEDIKSRPNSPIASNSKDGVLRYPACEEEYCDPLAQ
ncbi:DDE-1 domain-containing protein [Trichonephila clavipes]|nr:DDE-1 domain-containing protein [Trichonephila clavipes]